MVRRAIHQLGTNLSFGDAISNDMLEIQKVLRELGYDSEIYAQCMDPRMAEHFNLFTKYRENPDNLLIFHASMGGGVFDFFEKLSGKKMIIYHNMTPADYFRGYNDYLANLLEQGLLKVKDLSDKVDFAVGDSDFSRRDLVKMGFVEEKTGVLPIFVDFKKYDNVVNQKLKNRLKVGDIKNILFVGRFVPNKCQEDIIKAFYVYHRYFNPKSRLILIGSNDGLETYWMRLKKLVEMLGIQANVVFGGHVSFEDLATYYKAADLFLSMSEHEGFFVPILECFHLGVPVLAYKAGAVLETMGAGGVVFDNKKYDYVAKKMDELISDDEFRKKVVTRQDERLKDFDINKTKEKFKQILKLIK